MRSSQADAPSAADVIPDGWSCTEVTGDSFTLSVFGGDGALALEADGAVGPDGAIHWHSDRGPLARAADDDDALDERLSRLVRHEVLLALTSA